MVHVVKRDGSRVPYNEKKIVRSLKKIGTKDEVIDAVLSAVKRKLYNGITTTQLFVIVSQELKKNKPELCCKYNLKQALINLGFAGFLFEKFVAKILKHQGYDVALNRIIKGKNVTHEIDVSANKGNEKIMVECKHHSKPWLGTHIETALAVYARFLDVKHTYNKAMLVTNTKFTNHVINYSKGVGVQVMGWDYPKDNSLKLCVEKLKMYPVTALKLNKNVISACLRNNIITVHDVLRIPPAKLAKTIHVKESIVKSLIEQSQKITRT